ncbi:MAG TPA: alkaline phosphatase [Bacteroidales bacterium]|nr:alkaline phosphatase [Bacteroidales bacterium]
MNLLFYKRVNLVYLLFAVLLGITSCGHPRQMSRDRDFVPRPKNIIFFVGDGMGFNHVLATNYFESGKAYAQPFEQEGWTQLGLSTYPAVVSQDDGQILFTNGYSPRLAWTDPLYVASDATDSGAGGTALATGKKTFNNAIAISVRGDTLTQITQAAKAIGKAVGVVSSVHMSHATPASFAAHNVYRGNYEEIARYMLFNTRIDLIMAAGNPGFNDDGQPSEGNDRFVGGRMLWNQLANGYPKLEFSVDNKTYRVLDSDGDGTPDPWTVIQTREQFQNLASGDTPSRVLGIAQVNSTLQQGRSKPKTENLPFYQPLNKNIPTLAEMTLAALNILNQDRDGFFVMIEGGAIDWAGHDMDLVRTVEEQIDLNRAIQAAIHWVESYSSWDETLIIITADHETGYLTGIGHPEIINAPPGNFGKGILPGARFNSDDHTNSLVPFYAKGPGQHLFGLAAGGFDPVRGYYMQNVQVPQIIFMMWGKPDVAIHRQTR